MSLASNNNCSKDYGTFSSSLTPPVSHLDFSITDFQYCIVQYNTVTKIRILYNTNIMLIELFYKAFSLHFYNYFFLIYVGVKNEMDWKLKFLLDNNALKSSVVFICSLDALDKTRHPMYYNRVHQFFYVHKALSSKVLWW